MTRRSRHALWGSLRAGASLVMLVVLSSDPAQSVCTEVNQSPCNRASGTNVMRVPSTPTNPTRTTFDAMWVPDAPDVHLRASLTPSVFITLLEESIESWTSLSDTIPQDQVRNSIGFAGPFLWEIGWLSMEELQSRASEHTFITAYTTSRYGTVSCAITETQIYFAYNLHHPLDPDIAYYWADDCAPNCVEPTITYDLKNTMTHEYGHALGFEHSGCSDATMYAAPSPNDSTKRTLTAYESWYAVRLYGDNCGPSVLDSFTVSSDLGAAVCRWSVMAESRCRQYRLRKVCQDGTTTVLADSIPCLGPAVVHSFVDADLCAGESWYVLSQVDSLELGLFEEVTVAAAGTVNGSLPARISLASVVGAKIAPRLQAAGYPSPDQAIGAFGEALTGGDMLARGVTLGDGFHYVTRDGRSWPNLIDALLTVNSRTCLDSLGVGRDSLWFVPLQTGVMGEGVARVIAEAHYVRLPLSP